MYNIDATSQTPKVRLDPDKGLFEITGKMLPEDANEFFEPIIEKLNLYLEKQPSQTICVFYIEYMNTTASKYIFEIIKLVKLRICNPENIIIRWMYDEDDEDALDTGKDMEQILCLQFDYVEV